MLHYEETADGPIEFKLSDDSSIHFIAYTEAFSIGVIKGEMLPYGESYIGINLSDNQFWEAKINKKIAQIVILKSRDATENFPCEFALHITFENKENFFIQYLSNKEHVDTINIAKTCGELKFDTIKIFIS